MLVVLTNGIHTMGPAGGAELLRALDRLPASVRARMWLMGLDESVRADIGDGSDAPPACSICTPRWSSPTSYYNRDEGAMKMDRALIRSSAGSVDRHDRSPGESAMPTQQHLDARAQDLGGRRDARRKMLAVPGSSGAAVCKAGGVMAWERGRGEGALKKNFFFFSVPAAPAGLRCARPGA